MKNERMPQEERKSLIEVNAEQDAKKPQQKNGHTAKPLETPKATPKQPEKPSATMPKTTAKPLKKETPQKPTATAKATKTAVDKAERFKEYEARKGEVWREGSNSHTIFSTLRTDKGMTVDEIVKILKPKNISSNIEGRVRLILRLAILRGIARKDKDGKFYQVKAGTK